MLNISYNRDLKVSTSQPKT